MTPKRIQRKRTRGWRLPENAVYVGRPTVFGNPWRLEDAAAHGIRPAARAQWVVDRYARELRERGGTGEDDFIRIAEIRARLRGKDLCCWCKLSDPCHAEILLRVANGRPVVDVHLPGEA